MIYTLSTTQHWHPEPFRQQSLHIALNPYLHMTSQIFEAGINPLHLKINTAYPELCGNPAWLEIVELNSV